MNDSKQTTHYVDNKRFNELLKLRERQIEEVGAPSPKVENEVGEIILKIAENLSFRRNFINYSFRDEMIGDAVENCVRYMGNYDTSYDNPFAYFTQMCYYAFVRRITREDKAQKTRQRLYDDVMMDSDIDVKNAMQYAITDDLMNERG